MAPLPPSRRRLSLSMLALWSVLGACTESHEVEPSEPQAGMGGQSGSGGRAGTGGSGGSGNTGNETCDTGCSGASLFGLTVPGCCADDNKCGLDLSGLGLGDGCAQMNAPGTPNDACPSQSLGGFFTLAGCCRPDGTCGVLDTFVGLGCTSAGAAEETSCEP